MTGTAINCFLIPTGTTAYDRVRLSPRSAAYRPFIRCRSRAHRAAGR